MADHTPRTPHETAAAAPPAGGPVDALTVEDIRAAHKMLSGVARATAMEGSRYLSGLVGAPVHLKCENLQRTGSFKIRGAFVRIAGLSAQERAAGVVAASAGEPCPGSGAGGVPAGGALDGVHAGRRPVAEGRRDP